MSKVYKIGFKRYWGLNIGFRFKDSIPLASESEFYDN